MTDRKLTPIEGMFLGLVLGALFWAGITALFLAVTS